jgi:putative transposase
MANHVHLLLERGAVPLSRTLQTLQFTYSQYYNRCYGKTGHVFQGRYHAILCDRDAYLVALVRYLHLNPARVRQPLNPWQYPWSSHRAYLAQPSPVQLNTTAVLEQFHRQVGPARAAYRRFLKDGLSTGHQDQFYETVDQRFLGDARFLEELGRQVKASAEVSITSPGVTFPSLLNAVAHIQGVTPRTLLAPSRERRPGPARAMLVYYAREWCGLTTVELGRRLHRDPSMISRLYAAYACHRDGRAEIKLRTVMGQEVNTHARPFVPFVTL